VKVGHKDLVAQAAKDRGKAGFLGAYDGFGEPGAVECRPDRRSGRLQIRVADGSHLLEERPLYRGTVKVRQLSSDGGIVDFVIDEDIRQRRPQPDALIARQNTSHPEHSSSSSS
jgi:hypothetical protein